MKWQTSATMMFVGSLILGFFITSSLLVNSISDIRPSLTKFYLALYMAVWMVLLGLWMFPKVPMSAYVVVVVAIILVFLLARKQQFVDDKQYLEAMIQHHSSAILTSDRILEKTENEKVKKLAKWISQSQQKEIDEMNQMIKEL